MRLSALVFLALHLFSPSYAASQSKSSNAILSSEFGDFVVQVLKDWNSHAGVAVAVVRQNGHGGWIVEQEGYGHAKADGTPVTPDTLFAIGSESKLFDIISTGLLISNASLATPITWTSKLVDIMPGWELMDPIASAGATIVDLMSHRTGMPRHDVSQTRNDTIPNILGRMKYLKPSTEFRETFQYNNLMYEVLSYLPTVLLPHQPPFSEYVQENIFDPLGMNSSTYSSISANATGRMADSFGRVGNTTTNPLLPTEIYPMPFWLPTGEAGDFASGPGGVITSLRDMVAWLKMLISNGVDTSTNATVVPTAVLSEITSGITVWPFIDPYPELSPGAYGGARFGSSYRGHDLFEHGGDVQGFHSMVTWFPNDGAGVVVMINDDLSYYREIVRYRVFDLLFGLDPIDWNTRYQQQAVETAAAVASYVNTPSPGVNAVPPSVGYAALSGVYSNSGYPSLELCAIAPPAASHASVQTDSCLALATTLNASFPQYVSRDPDVPMFAFTWDSLAAEYVALTHFDGDLWNLTGWSGLPTDPHNASSALWAYDAGFAGTVALTGTDANGTVGFGFLGGIWGAGVGVPDPVVTNTTTPDEATEVWFAKL
ncbi:Beta-lactamase class penicillin binding protein [Mycena chlorophos]|uniref:Beta-lactamase class penicillin binding protein n=1 Tax=Mycena chlorophos TaxID=658473 RepID=A0A8H6VZA2_MYCCL|nr:Beta-lactamase class penicillin binding protein [Mycena chlorophos]